MISANEDHTSTNFLNISQNSINLDNSNNNNKDLLPASESLKNKTDFESNTLFSHIPTLIGQSKNTMNQNIGVNGSNINNGTYNRNRYAPYQSRSFSAGHINVMNYPILQPMLSQSFSGCSEYYNYISPALDGNYNRTLSDSSSLNNINNNINAFGIKKLNNNISNRNFNSFNTISCSSGPLTNQLQSQHNTFSMNGNSAIDLNNSIVSGVNNNITNDSNQTVTLQINNLDYSLEEQQLRGFLLNQLKPITPVISLIFEGSSCARVTVPDMHYAKQVISNLHRKKIGHKRVIVSYTRDSSSTEIATLRCQVAGLLKDVPYCTLPMYKFRELFQSRFKSSISVLDLYKMQDICTITTDGNDDKHITLNSELISTIENNPLMEGLHESVPYCSIHFRKEQHKGWAEQDIEPLPNVFMSISDMKQIICPLLKSHSGDIPIASLIYCIAGELGIQLKRNDNGVNIEHLVCCINGIHIYHNNFGVKVLGWLEPENVIGKENNCERFLKTSSPGDPLYQISKEVIELIKMSPKSTMKFNRFIPAYHNHFGKQCRVADYGYTKLIELFEALSTVVQIMGDGENRQITLTHRTQIRRFTTDLLRIIRAQGNKSVLLSQLPEIFAQTQNRLFDVTDYGVCAVEDILDGLANSNIIVITPIQNGTDILISIPKRKQTIVEIEKTCVFAAEVVELLANAPQFSILFQKFVRSYHYHFGYQCRLSDYGFLKLADLMEAIQGVVEIELTNDEDKKIFLSPKIARRVFAEQIEDLIKVNTGAYNTCIKLDDVLLFHKKKYGYQIQSQTLGFANIFDAIKELPFIEIIESDGQLWIVCHLNDSNFRNQTYKICQIILNFEPSLISFDELMATYFVTTNEILKENTLLAMKHAVDIKYEKGIKIVGVTRLIRYILKLVKVIEQYKTLTLGEIKKYLSITLGDCFEIGFPNITTLIHAYPDIFNFEINSLLDRSRISLVSSCPLLPCSTSGNNRKSQQFNSKQEKEQENKSFTSLSNSSINRSFNLYSKTQNNDISQQTNNYHFNNSDNFIKNYLDNEKENHFRNGNQFYKSSLTNNHPRYPPGFLPHSNDTQRHLHHYTDQYHNQSKGLLADQQQQQLQQQQQQQQQQYMNSSVYVKDNSFNASLSSSTASIDLNSSAINLNMNTNGNNLSLSNGSANSVTSSSDGMNLSGNETGANDIQNNDPFNDFPKLWTIGNNIDYFNNTHDLHYSEADDIFGLFKTAKTDTTDQSEIKPFWVDPIWGNDNISSNLPLQDRRSSLIKDSIKLEMSELQSFNVIPPALPQYELSDAENMKLNMFSFDSCDDKTNLKQ